MMSEFEQVTFHDFAISSNKLRLELRLRKETHLIIREEYHIIELKTNHLSSPQPPKSLATLSALAQF
jgi:hypothetical protein